MSQNSFYKHISNKLDSTIEALTNMKDELDRLQSYKNHPSNSGKSSKETSSNLPEFSKYVPVYVSKGDEGVLISINKPLLDKASEKTSKVADFTKGKFTEAKASIEEAIAEARAAREEEEANRDLFYEYSEAHKAGADTSDFFPEDTCPFYDDNECECRHSQEDEGNEQNFLEAIAKALGIDPALLIVEESYKDRAAAMAKDAKAAAEKEAYLREEAESIFKMIQKVQAMANEAAKKASEKLASEKESEQADKKADTTAKKPAPSSKKTPTKKAPAGKSTAKVSKTSQSRKKTSQTFTATKNGKKAFHSRPSEVTTVTVTLKPVVELGSDGIVEISYNDVFTVTKESFSVNGEDQASSVRDELSKKSQYHVAESGVTEKELHEEITAHPHFQNYINKRMKAIEEKFGGFDVLVDPADLTPEALGLNDFTPNFKFLVMPKGKF